MTRMPRRRRSARPPTTAPTMMPMGGEEDFEDVEAGGEVDVDWALACEAVGRRVVGVGALLWALVVVVDCEVALATGGTMLAMTDGIPEGSAEGRPTTVWLPRKDATTPPRLFMMLGICRRSCMASPAASQLSRMERATVMWSGCGDAVEAWLS
jgi:hypothetical protein